MVKGFFQPDFFNRSLPEFFFSMNILLFSFESVLGLPEVAAYIFVFVVGACVGSFLNVVIHRVPREESIVFPNSACPNCQSPIKPYDNLPLLSWLILRGKCRNCRVPISARYPAVELLTAKIFSRQSSITNGLSQIARNNHQTDRELLKSGIAKDDIILADITLIYQQLNDLIAA